MKTKEALIGALHSPGPPRGPVRRFIEMLARSLAGLFYREHRAHSPCHKPVKTKGAAHCQG